MNGHAFEALWSFSTALVARGTTVVRLASARIVSGGMTLSRVCREPRQTDGVRVQYNTSMLSADTDAILN